jgi:hypothetical protein
MSTDPAGLFIEDVEQQVYFRSRLANTAEKLFSAQETRTPTSLEAGAETKQASFTSGPIRAPVEPKPAPMVVAPIAQSPAPALTQNPRPQTVSEAEHRMTRFAELVRLPQALDFQDVLRKAEESELTNALGPLQGYETSRQRLEVVKESLDSVNKVLKDLIAETITDSLEISDTAKFEINDETGHIDYPELGAFSEAINSFSTLFTLVGSGLTVAQNIKKNKILQAQLADLRQNLGNIKSIVEAHSELQAIRQQRQKDLVAARGQAQIDIAAASDLRSQVAVAVQAVPIDDVKVGQLRQTLAAADKKVLDNSSRIQILERQLLALDRTLPRLTEFVAHNQAQLVLNENKLSALEHKVRLTNTSTVLAGISAVKAPTSLIKDALTFSGSATASTVGKIVSVVFLPLTLAKTIFSSVKLAFSAHEVSKINWKRDRLKEVQTQLRFGSNAEKKGRKAIEIRSDGDINPGNAALDRLLTASLDSLQSEKHLRRVDALSDAIDAVGGLLGLASGAAAVASLVLGSTVIGAPAGLAIAGAGALLALAGAGCVLGAAYWRNHSAKKNKNQLHDAQVGFSNLQNGLSLEEVARKNPFVANLVKIEAKRLKAEQSSQSFEMSAQERDVRIKQAVLEQCATFIENKHHNFNANLTCSTLNDELRDMAVKLVTASSDSAVMQNLEPEQRALLQSLVHDRPANLVGAIPAPDSQNPTAQRQYFELIERVISLSEGKDTKFDKEYPVVAALSVLALDTGWLGKDFEYGAQGIASIYYAGTRKNAADTLLVILGVAPLPVAEASADTYYKTQTGFASVGSSNGLASTPRESGTAAVLQILRKHRDLGKTVMARADQAAGSNRATEAFLKVPAVGETVTRSETHQAIEALRAFSQPDEPLNSNSRPLAPSDLVRHLVEKVGKGNSYIELSKSDVDFRENFRSRRRGRNNGLQFVKGLEKKFKSYGNQMFTGPLFVGIQRKTDNRDRHQFHLSVDPQATCQTSNGSVCQPEFLICNRSGIGTRADYVTYDRVGSQWFLSTSTQRVDVSLDPEIIRQKISSLTTPVAEKMLYIQIQRDISDNCELVGFEVIPALAQARPTIIPNVDTGFEDDLARLIPAT